MVERGPIKIIMMYLFYFPFCLFASRERYRRTPFSVNIQLRTTHQYLVPVPYIYLTRKPTSAKNKSVNWHPGNNEGWKSVLIYR